MSEEIALICTVEELSDYADSATHTFAMNISVGLHGSGAPVSPLAQALLQPWNWTVSGIAAWGISDGSTGASDGVLTTTLLVNPTVAGNALQTLKARLAKQFTDTLSLPQPNNLFSWDPAAPAAPSSDPVTDSSGRQFQAWPETVAHLSTYPAPVPHVLNLVLFFTVKTTDLSHVKTLVAAPLFSVANPATAYTAMSGAPTPPPPVHVAASEIGQGWSWQYSGDASVCLVAAHEPGLAITAFPPAVAQAAGTRPAVSPGAGRINLDTLWLTPEYEDGNEDWRSTLELRLSESFDLGRQLLDYVAATDPGQLFGTAPTLSLPTYGQAESLRQNILAVLRDAADFGLRYAPDGMNLLRFIADRLGSTAPAFDVSMLENELKLRDSAVLVIGTLPGYKSWTDMLNSLSGADPIALRSCTQSNPSQATMSSAEYAQLVRALRDLQGLLAQEANIASLVFTGWDTVFSALRAPAPVSTLWKSIRSAVQAQLNALAADSGLRKRMLLANLGGVDATVKTWSALTLVPPGSGDERTQVGKNTAAAILAYANQRMGLAAATAGDYQTRTPLLGANASDTSLTLPAPVQASLTQGFTVAATTTNSILTPSTGNNAAPSAKAQPAVLRVHTIESADDATDPLRAISGVGMLLRESSGTNLSPWTCLDAAALDILDQNGAAQTLTPSTFAPYRLMNRNGLLQAAVSYDNRPLAASSPADFLAGSFSAQSDLDTGGNSPYAPLFRFRYIADETQPWSTISALKFGRKYDALAFAVRSSGAMPNALAGPGTIAPISPALPADVTKNAPANLATTFTYLRRTPVGPLRIKVAGDADLRPLNQSSLPPIPATVAPLARELSNAGSVSGEGTLPLLLLWQSSGKTNSTSYSFEVRPPAAELEVWDRWVAGRSDADDFEFTRAAVRLDSGLNRPKDLADQNITNTPDSPAMNISLNDPAIIGLLFSLQPLYSPSGRLARAQSLTPVFVPYADLGRLANQDAIDAPGRGFALTQNNAYTVKVAEVFSSGAQPSVPSIAFNATNGEIDVAVPEGEVFRLSIAPCIAPDKVAWFDAGATKNQFAAPPALPAAPPTYIVSATPLEFLIETARASAISSQDVWNAVVNSSNGILAPDSAQSVLTLSLTAKTNTDWYLVRRTEIERQVWRWMGRPLNLSDISFSSATARKTLNQLDQTGAPGAVMGDALNWETHAFAERGDSPTVTEVNLFIRADATAASTQTIYTQDFATDVRAHYLRFSVTVFSRYDGLPGFQPFATGRSVAARATFPSNSAPAPFTPSIRAFIPCRIPISTALTKPKILLCLPLTGSPKNPTAPPSVLVIADEPWYLQGGLAEQLVGTVEGAVRNPPAGPQTTAEIGPDPIFYPNGTEMILPQPAATGIKPGAAQLSPWVGTPIGTTFDDVSGAPLMANTCFRFNLAGLIPSLPGPFPQSWDWTMAKLQFQRALDPSMRADLNAKLGDSASQLTDGTWVEFLPSSLAFTVSDGTSISVDDITFTWSTNRLQLQRTDSGTAQNVSLIPGPKANTTTPPNLQLWALLMRSITDAEGLDGELYVGLANLTMNTFAVADPNANVDHIYLLEIQSSPGAANNTYWIDDLFPNASTAPTATAPASIDTTVDVTHRVLRISGKITNY